MPSQLRWTGRGSLTEASTVQEDFGVVEMFSICLSGTEPQAASRYISRA